ncbi:MAG: hypothetical protein JWM82_2799, partial [Myxococcales bacterium]|nr:hypothetical protein [Myxococcales bacterium]
MTTEEEESGCPHVAKIDRHTKPRTKGCEE